MTEPAFQFKKPAELALSIIIVSFNTRDVLLDCLESVYAKTEGISYEIIVVDNASSDESPGSVAERFPDIHLIRNDVNRGFSTANNQGICESTGRWVALLNPDTRLIENSFQKIFRYMQEHPELSLLGSGIVDENNQPCPIRLWEDTPQDAAWKILGLYNPATELQRMGDMKVREALVVSGCCFVICRA